MPRFLCTPAIAVPDFYKGHSLPSLYFTLLLLPFALSVEADDEGRDLILAQALGVHERQAVDATINVASDDTLSKRIGLPALLLCHNRTDRGFMLRGRAAKQRENFTKILSRAVQKKERVIVRRGGKELAAVIPIEDLRLLERLLQEEEDLRDIKDARAALAEAKKKGAKPLPVFKKELGF